MTDDEMPVADRALPLRGAVNARDLGGLRTEDGRQVRRRRILRSDSLSELADEDVAFLLEHCSLRTIIDLRAPEEAEADGRGGIADSIANYRNTHIFGADRRRLDLSTVAPADGMLGRYISYLDHSGENIVAALELLASTESLPALVHCAAGKDRTGVVVAILLGILGVREDDVVADYAATGPNVEALRARVQRVRSTRASGVDTTTLPDWIFAADAATMRGFLAHVATEYGGSAGWAEHAGLPASARHRLLGNLLEPADT